MSAQPFLLPQRCLKCGRYVSPALRPSTPPPGGRSRWVCPKCGAFLLGPTVKEASEPIDPQKAVMVPSAPGWFQLELPGLPKPREEDVPW